MRAKGTKKAGGGPKGTKKVAPKKTGGGAKGAKATKGAKSTQARKPKKVVDEEIDSDDELQWNESDEEKFGSVFGQMRRRENPESESDESEGEEGGMLLSELLDAPQQESVLRGEEGGAQYAMSESESDWDGGESRPGPAGAEKEFSLPGGAGTSRAVLEQLLQETGHAVLKEQLGKLESAAMPEAISEIKAQREERRLQYEISAKQGKKWMAQVHRNRDADQVYLAEEGKVLESSVAELATKFKPKSDFERDIAEAVEAAGVGEKQCGDGILPGQDEELHEHHRGEQVARLKQLMFREYLRSKRLNRIKSKTWRKVHAKSEKLEQSKLLERLQRENPELAKELMEGLERKYAEQRTQRQRTARVRWAKVMQRFGGSDARQAVSQAAQREQDRKADLRRAVRGKQSDSSDEEDEALEEGEGTIVERAKRLAQKDATSEELPKTGIFGMKFMRDALDRKRQQADAQAKELLEELEGVDKASSDSDSESAESEAKPATTEATTHTPEELAKAAAEVDAMLADGWDMPLASSTSKVAGAVHVKTSNPWLKWDGEGKKTPAKQAGKTAAVGEAKRGKAPVAAGDAPITAEQKAPAAFAPAKRFAGARPGCVFKLGPKGQGYYADRVTTTPGATAPEKTPAKAAPGKAAKVSAKVAKAATKEAKAAAKKAQKAALDSDSDADEALFGRAEEGEAEAAIREAFGAGTHEEAYAPKDAEEPKPEFGWGTWAGEGAGMKTAVTQPETARRKKRPAPKPDADLARVKKPTVVVTEKLDRKAAKYFVADLPYGADTKDAYEHSLRHPTGPEWNAAPIHQKMIQPKVWGRLGKVVAPLQFAKHLDPKSRDAVIDAWTTRKKPNATRVKF